MWSLLSALIALPLASAAEPTVGAIIRPEVAVDIPAFTKANDFRDEHKLEEHTWMRAFARGESARGDSWFFEGRLQHHILVGNDYRDNIGLAPESWWALSLGDTGWDGKIAGPVRLRVGALTERWGKLDLLPIADVIAPHDQRSGFITPPDWQRMSAPMAILGISSERLRSETSIIPFPTNDLLWLRDNDWGLIRQGWVQDYMQSLSGINDFTDDETNEIYEDALNSATVALNEQTPQFRRSLDSTLLSRDLPEALLYNAEIGQRFELSARNLDFSVFGGYFRSRQAQSSLDPVLQDILKTSKLPADPLELQDQLTNVLTVSWPRMAVVGGDAAMLVGPLQVRAETMWQSARVVRTHYVGADSAPNLGVGLGIDYSRGSSFAITAEGRWMHLFTSGLDVSPDTLLFAVPDQFQLALGMRLSLLSERLTLQLGGIYDFSFQEYMAAGPLAAYRASDHVQFELGGVVLQGFKTKPPDSFQDSLTYQGGIGSYWSQNDALTFAVTFIQ